MTAVLSIHEAHDASAALIVDGVVVAAAQEERFTRRKPDYGFPQHSIRACLDHAGLSPSDLEKVVLAGRGWTPALVKVKRNYNFSVDDWRLEQHLYWRPRLFEDREVDYYDIFKDREDFVYDDTYPLDEVLHSWHRDPELPDRLIALRKRHTAERLGIDVGRVDVVTHEDCHIAYAYYGSPFRGEVLGFTAEAVGDYSNGTVSRVAEGGREELAASLENHLGHLYEYLTLLLGMKPGQHEYKVMGLAAYASERELARSYEVFRNVLKVDGLRVVFDQRPSDLYFHFRDAFETHRFDGIAGALQRFVEDILGEWVTAAVDATGLRRVCFAGGLAQNVKACKTIGELVCVDDIFVCPACGDTSLPIGACYYTMRDILIERGEDLSKLRPLRDAYLGPAPAEDDIERELETARNTLDVEITHGFDPEQIARLLADGVVVACCRGRMEFGLRALGNRSILADPRRFDTVRRINEAIKHRDFWMPFAPTVLAERADDYLVNPKHLRSPFMTLAFDSTELAQRELPAAMHSGDLSLRPQILQEEDNPDYYGIVKAFEHETGIGGVLNTSFNLHGEPIVLDAVSAIDTFARSSLDALVLGDWLIRRK